MLVSQVDIIRRSTLKVHSRISDMSAHASGLNFCAFLRAEADAAEDKARRLRIQAAALTQTAGLGIGEWA